MVYTHSKAAVHFYPPAMMFRNLDCARTLCTRGLYHAARKVLNPDPFNTRSSACTGVQSFKSANDPLE